MLMMVGSLTTNHKYSQEVIKMGWNPFDDGDTERDGVNAHRPEEPKKQSLRERLEERKRKTEDAINSL